MLVVSYVQWPHHCELFEVKVKRDAYNAQRLHVGLNPFRQDEEIKSEDEWNTLKAKVRF